MYKINTPMTSVGCMNCEDKNEVNQRGSGPSVQVSAVRGLLVAVEMEKSV